MRRLPRQSVCFLRVAVLGCALVALQFSARADGTAQTLSFAQDWSNTGLLTVANDWTGVPGIIGFRGDDLTTAIGTDPQTMLADGALTPVNVIANQTNPNLTTGGVAEFELANPTIALQGSGTADAPHIVLRINTTGKTSITIAYNLRDIDGSPDNAVQPVALQFRVGSSGSFTNVPAAFVADATRGPSLATLVTPVSVTLPAAADNQPLVELRLITTNAAGNDEWVGIDDISIADAGPAPTNPTGAGTANPSSLEPNNSTLLTVAVTPGANPTSTQLAITMDLSPIGGSSNQPFFDNGTNGDVTSGDSVFSFTALVESNTTPGSKTIGGSISDAQFRTAPVSISLTVVAPVPISAIHDIQGAGARSPFEGQAVRTQGIVTGRRTSGFFIQSDAIDVDADPNTSEGIFVFTQSLPPAAAAVGTRVDVRGRVQEFVPNADPFQLPLTEIVGGSSGLIVTAISSGQPLPPPVTLTAADSDPAGAIDRLERFEGMRVFVPSLTAIAPNVANNVNEPNATGSSSGTFYAVMTGLARPFREPGIDALDPLPDPNLTHIPRFDTNPERLRVVTNGLVGVPSTEVAAGFVVTDVVGVLDYGFRTYTIFPESSLAVTGAIATRPVSEPTGNQFTVGSFNLQRLFDTVNDPNIGEPVLTSVAFDRRLNKASQTIRDILRMPDILGVQEAENLSVLQALATRINRDSVANGQPDPGYVAYLEEGNDVGGIDSGFLLKSASVAVIDVTQVNGNTTYINPNNGQPEILHDRPPLVLRAVATSDTGATLPVAIIVNHLRSLSGIDDATDGNRVRTKRQKQAEDLANLVQTRQIADPNERLVLIGDFNAFPFNDGYVDTIGTIKGTPTPSDMVTLASPDLVNPDLVDLLDTIAPGERYSFSFDGNAQALDHAIITSNLVPRFDGLEFARVNADFPESLRNLATTPARLSDHDPLVAFFNLDPALTIADVTVNEGNDGTTAATFTVTLSPASTAPVSVTVATADGTAVAGRDYLARASTTLNFAPGVTTQTITVAVIGDRLSEATENFFVNLSRPVNALIVDAQGVAAIADNDPPPSVFIRNDTLREGDIGTRNLTFVVRLSAPSGQLVTVDFATANDTATAGVDYQAVAGTLTFPAGMTRRTISVPVNGDLVREGKETFFVNLSNATAATIADPQAKGRIVNDDRRR